MPDFLGFKYRVILDLYRILFHAVVIFGPEHFVCKNLPQHTVVPYNHLNKYTIYLPMLINVIPIYNGSLSNLHCENRLITVEFSYLSDQDQVEIRSRSGNQDLKIRIS